MSPDDEALPPPPALPGWPIDPEGLLRELGSRLRPDDLGIIAMADYGNDHAQHLRALGAIAATGKVPLPLPWEPREVVNLHRHDDPRGAKGEALMQWRARRAFCATVTLAALGQDPGDIDFDRADNCLGCLALDIAALKDAPHREAVAFLAWLLGRLPVIDVRTPAHLGVALLWHALQVPRPMPGADLVALAIWTMAAEDAQSRRHRWCLGLEPGENWLLGTCESRRSARAWEEILERLATLPVPRDAIQLREWTRLWAAMVAAPSVADQGAKVGAASRDASQDRSRVS